MPDYDFTIIASGLNPAAEDFESRFYEAGCDDATIAFQNGHIIVDFTRTAETAAEAISSAVHNVRQAGAHVDRIEPDPMVSLSDIASRIGKTRQAISLYASGKRREGFPPPAMKVTSDSPLWRWTEIAQWLHAQNEISQDAVIFAEAVEQANAMMALEREEFSLFPQANKFMSL